MKTIETNCFDYPLMEQNNPKVRFIVVGNEEASKASAPKLMQRLPGCAILYSSQDLSLVNPYPREINKVIAELKNVRGYGVIICTSMFFDKISNDPAFKNCDVTLKCARINKLREADPLKQIVTHDGLFSARELRKRDKESLSENYCDYNRLMYVDYICINNGDFSSAVYGVFAQKEIERLYGHKPQLYKIGSEKGKTSTSMEEAKFRAFLETGNFRAKDLASSYNKETHFLADVTKKALFICGEGKLSPGLDNMNKIANLYHWQASYYIAEQLIDKSYKTYAVLLQSYFG